MMHDPIQQGAPSHINPENPFATPEVAQGLWDGVSYLGQTICQVPQTAYQKVMTVWNYANQAQEMYQALQDPKKLLAKGYQTFTAPESIETLNQLIRKFRGDLGPEALTEVQQKKIDSLSKENKQCSDNLIEYTYLFLNDDFLNYCEKNNGKTLNIITPNSKEETDLEEGQTFPWQHQAENLYLNTVEQDLNNPKPSDYVYLSSSDPLIPQLNGWARVERNKIDPVLKSTIPLLFCEVQETIEKDKTLMFDLVAKSCEILTKHFEDFNKTVSQNQLVPNANALNADHDPWIAAREEIAKDLGQRIFEKLFPNGAADIPAPALYKVLLEPILPIITREIVNQSIAQLMTPKVMDTILLNILQCVEPDETAQENTTPIPCGPRPVEVVNALKGLELKSGKLLTTILSLASPQFKGIFETGIKLTSFDEGAFEKKVQAKLGESMVTGILSWEESHQGEKLFSYLTKQLDDNFTQPENKRLKEIHAARQDVVKNRAPKNIKEKIASSQIEVQKCTDKLTKKAAEGKSHRKESQNLEKASKKLETLIEQEKNCSTAKQVVTLAQKAAKEKHEEHFKLEEQQKQVLLNDTHKKLASVLSNFYPYIASSAMTAMKSAFESIVFSSSTEDSNRQTMIKKAAKIGLYAFNGIGFLLDGFRELTFTKEYNKTRTLENNSKIAATIIRLLHSPYHGKAIHTLVDSAADRVLETTCDTRKAMIGEHKVLPPKIEVLDLVKEEAKIVDGVAADPRLKKVKLLKWRDATLSVVPRIFRRAIRPAVVGVISVLSNSVEVWSWNNLGRSALATAMIGFATLVFVPCITVYGIGRALTYDIWRPLNDKDWVREVEDTGLEENEDFGKRQMGNKSRWILGALLPSKGHLVHTKEDGTRVELSTRAESEDKWIVERYRIWDQYMVTIGSMITRPKDEGWHEIYD